VPVGRERDTEGVPERGDERAGIAVAAPSRPGTAAVFTLLCLLPVPAVALSLFLPEPSPRADPPR
jgi:hypothetical protein